MKNKKYKIAIIGGGVCGLYLAQKLADKGNNVYVFEKKKEIGDNVVCSGLFSKRILDFFPKSEKLIQNRINSAILHFPKKDIKLQFLKQFLIIKHSDLEKIAGDSALNSGVKIFLNHNIEDINNLSKNFNKIIGCDGYYSVVRQSLNLLNPYFRLGIQGFIKGKSIDDYVDVWPCKNGFIWKIPQGNETEYGIISTPQLAKKLFEEFLKRERISIDNIKAKIIPQGFIIPSNNSITLCGDAAGLTKPWSGGGVIWGLKAADILLDSFPNFIAYRKKAKKFFLPKIIFSKFLTKIVYFLGFKMSYLFPKNNRIDPDFLL